MSVVILMYHGVEQREGPLFIDPAMFAVQADAIVESRVPVLTMSEIGESLRAGRVPPRAVALTFDDGFVSVLENAAPILQQRGLRATVFCVAGRLGGTNRWPTGLPGAPEVRLASAADVSRLVSAGFEIGAHGADHEPLDVDDPATIQREVADARVWLERSVGVSVRSLAYPYGALPSPAALTAVRHEYTTAVTTRIGRIRSSSDPYALPRVDAHYVRSPGIFRAVLNGGANGYLALRRMAATARRRFVLDYVPRGSEVVRS